MTPKPLDAMGTVQWQEHATSVASL